MDMISNVNKEILVIVPSRQRPSNANRLIESWNKYSEGKSDLIFVIDDDDPTKNLYPSNFSIIGEPGNLVSLTNRVATENAHKYKILGSIGDDHVFESFWESKFLNFKNPAVMYGDDGVHGKNLCTAFFMTTDIVKSLGYMIYPKLIHLYADNFAMEMGKSLNCLYYLSDVKITHYHPTVNKSEWDDTYNRGNSKYVWDADSETFNNWNMNIKKNDVKKVLIYIKG